MQTHDPLPSIQATKTGHPAQSPTKDTTESTSQNGTSEEDGDSLVDLFSPVPPRQEKVESWKKTSFEKTEAESKREERFVVLH